MDTDINTNAGAVYTLPEQCDLVAAAGIHSALIERLGETVLELDAGQVERCGTAVAQILLAASRELEGSGGRLALREATPAFRQCFEDLGLAQDLHSWE